MSINNDKSGFIISNYPLIMLKESIVPHGECRNIGWLLWTEILTKSSSFIQRKIFIVEFCFWHLGLNDLSKILDKKFKWSYYTFINWLLIVIMHMKLEHKYKPPLLFKNTFYGPNVQTTETADIKIGIICNWEINYWHVRYK